MPLSREEVIWAFQLILGREPGDEGAIAAHMQLAGADELAAVLLTSAEFRANDRFKDFLAIHEPSPAPTPRAVEGPPGWGQSMLARLRDAAIGLGSTAPSPAQLAARPRLMAARATKPAAPPITFSHESRASRKVLLLGNCQVAMMGRLMQAMTGDMVYTSIETLPSWLDELVRGEIDLEPALREADLVFVQLIGVVMEAVRAHYPEHQHKLRLVPPLNYAAFHPDCVYIAKAQGGHLQGPMRDYHSSIAFWAWKQGWSVDETLTLFRHEVYEQLGFYDFDATARQVLLDMGRQADLPMQSLLGRWAGAGVWMHTVNHPRVNALADLTVELLRREGIEPMPEMALAVEDTLTRFPIWPVYPPIAARRGLQGSYLFKIDLGDATHTQPLIALSLRDFVEASFACYAAAEPGSLKCERIDSPAYAALAQLRPAMGHGAARPAPSPGNPYKDLPDHHFWRRMIELTPAQEVDPIVRASWRITAADKVATAGSCFAQHISGTLARNGFNYFVAEAGEDLPAAERTERQFGVFSARYGNLYTARQLLQLFDRAYGQFQPLDQAWQRPDGRWVDPFRPQVEPAGHASPEEVVLAAREHLAAVRRLFEQMDVFVFTLGLTEAWRRQEDGAVFPLAPGVVAGAYDPDRHGFVNFGVAEVVQDIQGVVARLRGVNPRVRLMFTVSPVPLIATYENRHVLVSTVQSKSVLRAAIGAVAAGDPGVEYFPSYEIVTGQHARGAYFAADLRSVTPEGVAHVMRMFMKHYAGAPAVAPAPAAPRDEALLREQRQLADVICDEEAIVRHRDEIG